MRKLFYILILVNLFFVLSCGLNQVVRWPDEGELLNSQSDIIMNNNIFNDYLWTTPPVYSKEIIFSEDNNSKKTAIINFKGEELKFELISNNGIDIINLYQEAGSNISSYISQSKKNIYYDLNSLSLKYITRQRWVSRTTFKTETVPVTRTRSVPYTSFGPNGTSTTSYRTETYTDWETRTVPVIDWYWESYSVPFIDIPVFKYFQFTLSENETVLVYEIQDGNSTKYFFQNVSYIVSPGNTEAFKTEDTGLLLVFIDSDSNGYYFDDSDRVLFNTWNPYEESSQYREIPGFMNNHWYRIEDLRNEKFITFKPGLEHSILNITNANHSYIGNENLGELEINNIGDNSSVIINGTNYHKFLRKNTLDIEYGMYYLRIENPGYLDYEQYFTIDENNSDFVINYIQPEPASILEITNLSVIEWILIIKDSSGDERHYSNRKSISLPEGVYTIIISSGGFDLEKNIIIEPGINPIIDYDGELTNLMNQQ